MKILFLLLFSFILFAQEETKEDKCAQELEQKCTDPDGKYNCIMADPTNEKKNFSKECFPKFKKDLEVGKYSHPCLDEVKKACPNTADLGCVKSKRASFAPECQEMINDQGVPQAPNQEGIDKFAEECKGETITNCDPLRIKSEIASWDDKDAEADKKMKEYIECMKKVYQNPKDEKCQEAKKVYVEEVKKEGAGKAQGKGYQEIKQ
jgi:hypothetical protein